MDRACDYSSTECEPEIKKLRKDLNSDAKDTDVLLDTGTLVHGRGKECLINHSNPFGVHTTVVPKEDTNKTKNKRTVYIWDMDETLILLKSLLNGKYAEPFSGSKDVQHGIKIGRRWERHILQVCDEFFYYEQVENFNESHLDAWSDYDDGMDLSNYDFNNDNLAEPSDDVNRRKHAYRYRCIRNKFVQGLHKLLDNEQIQIWQDLYDVTDAYTDGWLSAGRAFLEDCLRTQGISTQGAVHVESRKGLHISEDDSASQNVNVLVTSGTLVPSLVKCLLFGLDGVFTYDNVYSSWDVGKLQCFQLIKKRFEGPGVQFCVIGDGMEECQAAESLSWPFVKIDPHPNGVHRFPGLSLSTIKHYLNCIYDSSQNDGPEK
ncbi:eyes absent homolog [Cryptomeria japonica]|uniref:eyes absent homolog n=1 Tax=Cryptomeria japonica TaxID=3369 RepID=UPI0027D9F535|nr:eyes absent homolog [Cryptomeria japonica]XP_057822548.2 eyes absent homolog [Cryptomeria japonica]XP_057822549.2 eyes absent homolog [Cryptomeria japonica]